MQQKPDPLYKPYLFYPHSNHESLIEKIIKLLIEYYLRFKATKAMRTLSKWGAGEDKGGLS